MGADKSVQIPQMAQNLSTQKFGISMKKGFIGFIVSVLLYYNQEEKEKI